MSEEKNQLKVLSWIIVSKVSVHRCSDVSGPAGRKSYMVEMKHTAHLKAEGTRGRRWGKTHPSKPCLSHLLPSTRSYLPVAYLAMALLHSLVKLTYSLSSCLSIAAPHRDQDLNIRVFLGDTSYLTTYIKVEGAI